MLHRSSPAQDACLSPALLRHGMGRRLHRRHLQPGFAPSRLLILLYMFLCVVFVCMFRSSGRSLEWHHSHSHFYPSSHLSTHADVTKGSTCFNFEQQTCPSKVCTYTRLAESYPLCRDINATLLSSGAPCRMAHLDEACMYVYLVAM